MKLASVFSSNSWNNPDITLYHGTTAQSADSILDRIVASELKDSSDFGRGFYTTTNLVQAQSFASRRARHRQKNAAVVKFVVSRDELFRLESLWFVRAASDTEDFWNLVRACVEGGESNRGATGWYDLVVGPVSGGYRNRRVWENYDQISFHTPKAFLVLDNSKKVRL
jgi:hypothetical protein